MLHQICRQSPKMQAGPDKAAALAMHNLAVGRARTLSSLSVVSFFRGL